MTRTEISKDPSGRIIVSFPYNPLIVSKVKIIKGRRQHPVKKHSCSHELAGVLKKILKAFGDEDVQIAPSLKGTPPDVEKADEGGFEFICPQCSPSSARWWN
jgi:hypothetical protein